MVYKYYSWAEYVEATNKLLEEGCSLVSPGYFKKYGVMRQNLFGWAKEKDLIRQYNCYLSDPNKADIVLIPVEDVLAVLRGKKAK